MRKQMRKLKRIIIHAAATPPDMDIGLEEINEWHLARGWSGIGYHFVIRRNGSIENGRPMIKQGAHVKGHNRDSIGICLVGGKDGKRNDRINKHYTDGQIEALKGLIQRLHRAYGSHLTVHGHNEFANKGCPCFQVSKWYKK